MTEEKIPCQNCVLIAVCRHRDYHDMLNTCKLLESFLYKKRTRNETEVSVCVQRAAYFNRNIVKVRDILRPTDWYLDTTMKHYAIRKYSEPPWRSSPYE